MVLEIAGLFSSPDYIDMNLAPPKRMGRLGWELGLLGFRVSL